MGSGAGYGLSFGNTKGSAVPGDESYMGPSEEFLRRIRRRRDVDPGGKFDVIAHGTPRTIEIEHNGSKIQVNSRTAAKMIKRLPGYEKGQPIRLLSCSTGMRREGFAQNLANKLNATVYAPSDMLWVRADGSYFVAAGKRSNQNPDEIVPDYSRRGSFIKYKPGGNKR